MTFAFPRPADALEQRVLDDVQQYGWSVIQVPEDDEGPGFAFTIGLTASYQHPEIIVIGLSLDVMHALLNIIGEDVKGGQRFEAEHQYAGLITGAECAFLDVAATHFRDFLGTAMWFYQNQPFQALQCVWPDKEGHYLGMRRFVLTGDTCKPCWMLRMIVKAFGNVTPGRTEFDVS